MVGTFKEERIFEAFDQLSNPLFITEPNGIFFWVNKAFERHTGYSKEELIGIKTPNVLNSGVHPKEFFKKMWETITKGLPFESEVMNKKKDGSTYIVRQTTTPLFNDLGSISKFISIHIDITDVTLSKEHTRQQSIYLKHAQSLAKLGYWRWDAELNTLEWSENMFSVFNIEKSDVITMAKFLGMIHKADVDNVKKEMNNAISGRQSFRLDFRIIVNDEVRYLHSEGIVEYNSNNFPKFLFGITQDITTAIKIEKELQNQLKTTSELLEATPNPVIYRDKDDIFIGCNKEFEKFLKKPKSEYKGKHIKDIIPAQILSYIDIIDKDVKREKHQQVVEVGYSNKFYLVKESPFMLEDGSISGIITTFVDITNRKNSEERTKWFAEHDPLTGLPNRHKFNLVVEDLSKHQRAADENVAILLLDLDHFKDLNDTLGHDHGDALLKSVADRLVGSVRKEDTVCRLGGDEFAILLPNVGRYEGAARVAEKIIRDFKNPFDVLGNHMHMDVSIGITLYPLDGDNFTTLLKQADLALYKAKEEGRGQFRFYVDELNRVVHRKKVIEENLRHSLIVSNEFEMHFQPRIRVTDGKAKVVSSEALIRWNSNVLGSVSPVEFIPVAEKTGLIGSISCWIFKDVFRKSNIIHNKFPDIDISVNISPGHFKTSSFCSQIEEIMKEENVKYHSIELEITENIMMDNSENNLKKLTHLSNLGIKFSIDDFGTGYSSLSYLKKFPVSCLKIDKSFIQGVKREKDNTVIVEAIIQLCKSLGLVVIAEGVETKVQLDFLLENGCNNIQGYYYSKPLPFEEFMKFIENFNKE